MDKKNSFSPEISGEIIRVQKKVVSVGHDLVDKSLVAGTWGNISARVFKTDLIAITPSGRDYRQLTAGDILTVDSNGMVRGEMVNKPSSELPLHLAIYRARPDVGAIVHTHSVFASACAAAGKSIPPIIEDLVQLTGGSVEVAKYALPGTSDLALNAVAALENKMAVLLANHGMVGCGRNLDEALTACELVEKTAQIYIYANLLGGAKTLSQQDVDAMHDFYLRVYSKR